jgi:methyl-accepting chemotaxis protein
MLSGLKRGAGTSLGLRTMAGIAEAMPVAVVTCDPKDLRITYANRAAVAGLEEIGHVLPRGAGDIVGRSIDILWPAPRRPRDLLADPTLLPHRALIAVGDQFLDLVASALHRGGKYVGPMLTWQIVTARVRAERESEKLMTMLEHMPVNVMMLDPETLAITCVNRASIDTLRPLQHLLAVPADRLVGHGVDILCDNPVRERAILSDPANLPHHARFRLGEETLDLRFSAVADADGRYVGLLLSWAVVSGRVALADDFERSVGSVVDAVAAAAARLEAGSSSMAATTDAASIQVSAVAAASDEIRRSIFEIARQLADSNEITSNALAMARQSSRMIEDLSGISGSIGEAVGLVRDIADQTNLLALNAAIEAARAGDAGRGFGVVASEVKELAHQMAKATDAIARQIGVMEGATTRNAAEIQEFNRIIDQMARISTAIAAAVEQQSAAADRVARNIEGVREASARAGTTVVGVGNAASDLTRQSGELAARAKGFLEQVRAI